MLTVACVLKRGGDFDGEYVRTLAKGIKNNLRIPYSFLCLTDMPRELPIDSLPSAPVETTTWPLGTDWRGWWSKMELFRLPGPVLYIDLDTCIVGDITTLADYVTLMSKDEFLMLRGFYRNDLGSGIMGWNGDWSWIYDDFCGVLKLSGKFISRNDHFELSCQHGRFRGDQDFISWRLKSARKKIVRVQDVVAGIYSYKVHVRDAHEVPPDASIVCFHGKPRPTEIEPEIFAGK